MIKKNKLNISSTQRYNIILLIVLIAVMAFFTILNPKFIKLFNIMLLFRINLPIIIIACPMMFVIASGAIDLSVGGVMALSAITYATLCVAGVNPWLAIVFVAVLGVVIGIINTMLIEKLEIPAFMATIAGWLVYGGLAYTVCGGANPISKPEMQVITVIDQFKFFDAIPLALPIILVVVAVYIFLEKKTIIGKYAIAIGGNYNAAYFSGINVFRMRMLFFILCSTMAALSGVWQVARLSTADPKSIGLGAEFSVLSACILGGVNIKGGQGSIIGAVMGAFLLAVLINGMQMIKIPSFYQQVITGLVLLIVVFINYMIGRKRNYE